MLPASAGTVVVLLAAFLSGQAPAMLNWTLGEASFEHTLRTGNVSVIVTSRRFFEKAAPDWMREKYASRCRFLEDLLSDGSPMEKLRAFLAAAVPFFGRPKRSDDAVTLFTSGSESLPKAVRLTWENVASDIRGALAVMPVRSDDALFSFLPVFHSFGFTIGSVLPLLSGLRTAYSPDPGDARTVCSVVRKSGATLLASPPTFFKFALESARPGDLDSLRKLIVGAEKCPDALFSRVAAEYPKLTILEGYGITECSPVISINPPDAPKAGSVGLPIPSNVVRIFPIDGGDVPVPPDTVGMIFVRGTNVFAGYADPNLPDPFETRGGERFYKTGDLGFLDAEGYLHITGRLKRFVKIAGEMVSLPALEAMLAEAFPSESGVPEIALEAREADGAATIVCFSVRPVPVSELHKALRERGAPAIAQISRCHELPEIPLLGTGKIDYKRLKELV